MGLSSAYSIRDDDILFEKSEEYKRLGARPKERPRNYEVKRNVFLMGIPLFPFRSEEYKRFGARPKQRLRKEDNKGLGATLKERLVSEEYKGHDVRPKEPPRTEDSKRLDARPKERLRFVLFPLLFWSQI
ncbi:hypothetical protein TNCT_86861 [Trichonephila clavata]|uniref:Uncharacterized protein n=1 Tax=Trichonephila clavata TaxID=2740835 RepID=A0A8X6LNG1_TRICU|nr:hypothetical protein TNCT_86861 [Trichonephila clavata]